MHLDRDAFLLLVSAIAACHVARPAPEHAASKPRAATSASAPASVGLSASASPSAIARPAKGVDDSAACAEMVANNRGVARNAKGKCVVGPEAGELVGDEASAREALHDAATDGTLPCRSGPGGVWGVEVHDAHLASPASEGGAICGWHAQADLVFEAPSRTRLTRRLGEMFRSYGTGYAEFSAIHDLDGDGRGELFLIAAQGSYGACGNEWNGTWVLQATDTSIVDYPVGFPFTRVASPADVDGDGRPDLLDDAHWTTLDSPGGLCGPGKRHGTPILLHALPGGKFSRDDAVARRFARGRCPIRPAEIHEQVACARIWGATEAEVMASATAAFANLPKSEREPRLAAVRGFAKTAPPFQPLSIDAPDPLPGDVEP